MGLFDKVLGKTQKKVYVCCDDEDRLIAEYVCAIFEDNDCQCQVKGRNAKPDAAGQSTDEISKADLLVLIYSKNCCRSDSVAFDIDTASAKNVPILVFHVDESKLTGSLEPFLENEPWIDARGNFKDKLDTLCLVSLKMIDGKNVDLDYRPLKESSGEIKTESVSNTKTTSPSDNRPLPSYEGGEPYIFISYKHADYEMVFPIIRQFQDAGFNVCYDAGLSAGANYDIQIAKRIKDSALFITFMTKNVIKSADDYEDYTVKELSVAISLEKPCLPIYLEDVELGGYYLMHYMSTQSIFKPEYDDDMFIAECIRTFGDFGIEADEVSGKAEDSMGYITNMPFEPYEGDEPYIFASYNHSDWKEVYPLINRLHEAGLNIWYDAGLARGRNYDIQIANHVRNSSLFITFITEELIKGANDENDYTVKELGVATSFKNQCLPIFLDDVNLEGFYLMHYLGKQSIFKPEFGDNEDRFFEAFLHTLKEDFGFEINETQPEEKTGESHIRQVPFKAYGGDEPYIFASYKHADRNLAYPVIKRLHDEGFNVCHDQDMVPGSEWLEEIQNAIEGCSVFVPFITRNVMDDEGQASNIYANELRFAIDLGKEIMPIFLEDVQLRGPYRLFLSGTRSIFKHESGNDDDIFISQCTRTLKDLGMESKSMPKSINEASPITEDPLSRTDSQTEIEEGKSEDDDGESEDFFADEGIPDFGDDLAIEVAESQSKDEEDDSYIKNRPFEAYEGDDPFIFISYKHDDWRKVYPAINQLHEKGFNIWYDASLKKGKSYDIQLVKHIKKASLFITFITKTVIDRSEDDEDYLVKELNVAVETKKDRLPIFLEEIGLDGYFLMHYSGKQSIFKHEYGSDESRFIDECTRAFINDFGIEPCETPGEGKPSAGQATCKPFQLSCLINSRKGLKNPPIDVIEKLADRIYGSYKARYDNYLTGAYMDEISRGEIPDSFFAHLDNFKSKKGEFRKEAKNRIMGLYSIGYDIVDKADERNEVSGFKHLEEIELAKYNHYLWCENKLKRGFEYGYKGSGFNDLLIADIGLAVGPNRKSNKEMIVPYRDSLNLWQDLNHDEQKGNIDFVNEIFTLLPSDLKIISTKAGKPKYNDCLENLIQKGEKEIVLDSDIIFDTAGPNGIYIGTDDLTIDGNGHTIDAGFLGRIFTVTGKNITLKSINFINAVSHSRGGAISILERASCKFYNCSFENNVSDAKPDSSGKILASDGGAIYNEGSCSLVSCVFKNNDALGENVGSKDIAPYESFELINCTFDGESKTQFDEITILGMKYAFRDSDCEVYRLAESIYPYWHPDNKLNEFTDLSDEKYSSYERIAIRALCVAKAAEGRIYPNTHQGVRLDSRDVLTFENIKKSSELYAENMMNLGWKNGKYDYEKKTINLSTFGGSLAADREERYVATILECLTKADYSIFKEN